ncbi:peptide ABC transporter [Enterococcus casseliflavus]|uniref:ABC transporter ATP-binding protein n=1 Tax=Enterococcus casseliflavus TaxID=37734 RepID=UPI0009BC8E4D|nr:ABC transporter ATP-binding protein [Enterococcus casseliflavus]OQO85511.1 peptide ABC transporter [Enterococcus casseliflavus]
MKTELLAIEALNVTFHSKTGPKPLVKKLDLVIPKGKVVGIVGESGSGKSMTMKSVMDLLPDKVTDHYASYTFEGVAVTDRRTLPIAMIFQDPMTSLNPLRTIGYHLIEVILRSQNVSKKAAQEIAVKELEKVGIPFPAQRMKQYPHELSGGMRQRVMIAMALLAQPKLLIADEPTTALDVTIQAQILALIKNLQRENQLSVVLVTHDFGVVAGMCDFIKVMYQGRVVEEGTTEEIFYQPAHPYTKQLLQAAHLGDKHAELKVFDYHETLADELQETQLSKTHRVWRNQEVTE